jgi:hypothetical protein
MCVKREVDRGKIGTLVYGELLAICGGAHAQELGDAVDVQVED